MDKCVAIQVAPDVTLYHTGPPLDLGPLPSLFYFALSGSDSLTLDPYNQPVQFLKGKMVRVFSMTLPGHENNLPATEAIRVWADDYAQKKAVLDTFLDEFNTALNFAIREKFVDVQKMGVAGLSRGGLLALHAAARDERLKYVLGFAPVTDLCEVHEFNHLIDDERVRALSAVNLSPFLIHQHLKLYSGNCDTRVGTRACIDFALSVVEHAQEKGVRSPKVELSLYPSVGIDGHGTPLDIFREGATWMASCLCG